MVANNSSSSSSGSGGSGGAAKASSSATLWLLAWTVNNIGVTLMNKAAFAKVNFHYPYTLSCVHMICNMTGSQLIFWLLKRQLHLQKLRAAAKNSSTPNSSPTKKSSTANDAAAAIAATKADTSTKTKSVQSDSKDVGSTTTTANGVAVTKPSSSSSSSSPSHASSSSSSSSWIITLLGPVHRASLDSKVKRSYILAFSVIFSLNIAIGNVSLKYVSVNFNQVLRSLVPGITIAMGLCLGKTFTKRRMLAVVPVMVGVAMATFGDMSYTATGFVYTVFCIILAALKVVASGEMLTGSLKMHPVDLLGHMAPLAAVQCLILALWTGEVASIRQRWTSELSPFTADYFPMAVVWASGLLSFSLNICSLQANKLTSPLTLCIAANVKQVLMIGISTAVFGTHVTPLNGAGILVVLAGSARYSYVSVMEKILQGKQNKKQPDIQLRTTCGGTGGMMMMEGRGASSHDNATADEEQGGASREMVHLIDDKTSMMDETAVPTNSSLVDKVC